MKRIWTNYCFFILTCLIGKNAYTAELKKQEESDNKFSFKLPQNAQLIQKILKQQKNNPKNIFPSTICVFGPQGTGKSFIIKEICRPLRSCFVLKHLNQIIKNNQKNITYIDRILTDIVESSKKTIFYMEASNQKIPMANLIFLAQLFNTRRTKNASLFVLEITESPNEDLSRYFQAHIPVTIPSEPEAKDIVKKYAQSLLKNHQQLCPLLLNYQKLYTSQLTKPQLISVIKMVDQLNNIGVDDETIINQTLQFVHPLTMHDNQAPSYFS